MNVLLWVLQAILAFLYIASGAYKLVGFEQLAGQIPAISGGAWRAIGLFEIAGALLLVFPAALKLKPMLTPLAAAFLAVETLALAAVYGHYSLAIAATNPMVWAIPIGLVAAFVAWGRYARDGRMTTHPSRDRHDD